MSATHAYKVLTLDQWVGFQSTSVFTGSPVDIADGYIHMSGPDTLKTTLDKWYIDQTQVVILEINLSNFGADLIWEISRGGAKFPHLYTALPMAAVGRMWQVSPDAQILYTLPSDL